ncbi:MAG: O-antigen ligase family protein [Halobacteriovoraceae bacterium]|nr:O-antigen ligase family protein [Halobacteriovoraceae bacterium]
MSIISFLGILEFFSPNSTIFSFFRTQASLVISPRIASILQWPNQLAILVSLSLLFTDRKKYSQIFITIIFTTQIILTSSRNGLLALILVLIYKTIREKQVTTLILVILTFLIFTPLKNYGNLRTYENKKIETKNISNSKKEKLNNYSTLLNGGGVEASTTVSLRLALWKGGLKELVEKNLLFGIGPDNFRKIVTPKIFKFHAYRELNAHNIFINFLVEWGLIGFIGFLLITLYIFTHCKNIDFKFVLIMFFSVQIFDCFNYDVFFMFSFLAILTILYHSELISKDKFEWKLF